MHLFGDRKLYWVHRRGGRSAIHRRAGEHWAQARRRHVSSKRVTAAVDADARMAREPVPAPVSRRVAIL